MRRLYCPQIAHSMIGWAGPAPQACTCGSHCFTNLIHALGPEGFRDQASEGEQNYPSLRAAWTRKVRSEYYANAAAGHAGHGVLLAVPDGRAKLHCSGTTPPPGHLGATAAEGECSRAAWWTLSDRHWREATKAMLHPDPPCRGGLCRRPAALWGTRRQAAAVGGEGGFYHDAPHHGQAAI
jgi:hypothetical protein